MSIVKGIKNIEAILDKKSGGYDGPRIKWLQIPV